MKSTINTIKNILELTLKDIDNPLVSKNRKIHSARVMSKKLRSTLYLIKPYFKNNEFFKSQNMFYKELSKIFSQERENKVMYDTFLWIVKKCKFSFDSVKDIQIALKKNMENNIIADADIDKKLQTCEQSILVAISNLHILGDCIPKNLTLGFKKTYQKAYENLNFALITKDTKDIHLFRKYAKYHMYQLQLLQDTIKHAKKRAKNLDKLTSTLGMIHDLALFEDYLQNNLNLINSEILIFCIAKIQKKLTKKALKSAIKIFRYSPKKFKIS